MNQRERYIETLTFGHPDRIPLVPGGPRESTIQTWLKQGLPQGVDYQQHLWDILGIDPDLPKKPLIDPAVDFCMIPQFEEKVLEHKDGHYIVQDWKGNICEISDQFDVSYLREAIDFVTRRWIKCPVENRDDWEEMKTRYVLESPGRFADDLAQRAEQLKDRDYFLQLSFSGPFWQLREWCGFEGLCMMMIEQPKLVAEMADFWSDFISAMLEEVFKHFVPDGLLFNEDMAYKAKAMISPAMARQFCKPSWDRWTAQAKAAGVPVIAIDSDGYIGELIPIWIESGVNCCEPIEVAAHCDINAFRREFGHKIAYRGGIDKRCMAKGSQVLSEELRRIETVLKGGGYIPGCDHGVPSDVSWPNFVEYTRLLAKMTGWL